MYQLVPDNVSVRNGDIEVARVLNPDLLKRCRADLIVIKSCKKFTDSFHHEISVMYQFAGKQNNIVQLVGFCYSPYRIMVDYYSLGSLYACLLDPLQSNVIQPSKNIAISLSLQIAMALSAVHKAGFVHCCVNLSSVFVDKNERGQLQCYLGDFSMAQSLNDPQLAAKVLRGFNLQGFSSAYAAPEILECLRSQSAVCGISDFKRTDVYSIGISFFEILHSSMAW